MFLTTKFLGFGTTQFLAAQTFIASEYHLQPQNYAQCPFVYKISKRLKESRENLACNTPFHLIC